MKTLALLLTMLALTPIANAEQGDAEDRGLTEQMTKQTVTHETQPTQTPSDAAYGDPGKTAKQSGHSELKAKAGVNPGQ
jgi:hypothetical protein